MELINIRGARVHNLKNVDVAIPRGCFIVLTGLSGSGKSSLAFDTIYAEGQRRYVESLSSYARQFLGMMEKPDVESITGLSPAISIEQKTVSHNPRSTVGTVTEIHDYLRLLFARAGVPHCPVHHKPLTGRRAAQIVDDMLDGKPHRLALLAPVIDDRKGEHSEVIHDLAKRGFIRLRIDDIIYEIEDTPNLAPRSRHTIEIVIDRLRPNPDDRQRILESVETALEEGNGRLRVLNLEDDTIVTFSSRQACPVCAYSPPVLEPKLFSFNSATGACQQCNGLGDENVVDEKLLVADPELSLAAGAIPGWSRNHRFYFRRLSRLAKRLNFATTTPYKKLPATAKKAILHGWKNPSSRGRDFEGILPWIHRRWRETEAQPVRDWYGKFISTRNCSACGGDRLRAEARAVLVGAISLPELARMPLRACHDYLAKIDLDPTSAKIAERILREVIDRLGFLVEVGLGYLSLSRSASTLSGGENQRIRLASQVGSGLTGVTYVLDEPSIGLHSADNERLLASLMRLRDLGNSVLVVEHDEAAIRSADHIVDLGPGAGRLGGEVVASGSVAELTNTKRSITGDYLAGRRKIKVPARRKRPVSKQEIKLFKTQGNNLRNASVAFPLGLLICVTGVSGSGKSTLVADTLQRSLARHLHHSGPPPLPHAKITGMELIDKVIDINQSPIGRTPRSNPATYTGLFTPLRALYAELPLARERGYKAGHFSFNVPGGRCDACEGDGVRKVEMHFLPDVYVTCEVCQGMRYKNETLEVRYRGKSIHDILEMTVSEAGEFFKNHPLPSRKLNTLDAVGLGYMRIGQSAPTLSGGEAQRVKLALELSKVATGNTLYILDEPTTGLHFYDVDILLKVLEILRDGGNTVIVVEHNMDVIKTCDWIIDLGPGGGNEGGKVVAVGPPEKIAANPASLTGRFLKPELIKPKTRKRA